MSSCSPIGLLRSSRSIHPPLRSASCLVAPYISVRQLNQGVGIGPTAGVGSAPSLARKEFTSLGQRIRHGMRSVPHPLMIVTSQWDVDRHATVTIATTTTKKRTPSSRRYKQAPVHPTSTSPRKTNHPGLLVSSFNTITFNPRPYVSFNIKIPSSTYDAITSSRAFTITAISSIVLADEYRREGGMDSELKIDTPGVLFQMKCSWSRRRSKQVGDHILVVGEVEEYLSNESSTAFGKPLIYSEGTYRTAGEPLAVNGPTTTS